MNKPPGNMDKDLYIQLQKAYNNKTQLKGFLEKLAKKPPKNLDYLAQEAHDEVFAEVDCLKCANCCKTTSPIFRMVDIERLSKHLKTKPQLFIEQYLHIDSDGDHVLNGSPCPFLDDENYCRVYESRPNACREYPHTDRKRFHQITALTFKNTQVCPAASKVVEKIRLAVEA